MELELFDKKISGVPKLSFPNDKSAKNAFNVFQPSIQSELFLSEEGRTIFAEAFNFEDNPFKVLKLSEMALKIYVKHFRDGPLDKNIVLENFVAFGESLDVNLPILNLLEMENEIFWKRVVEAKIKNRLIFYKLSRSSDTNWRQLGIEVKLVEIFETTKPEDWNEEFMENLITKVSPLVETFDLREMIPLKFVERNPYDSEVLVKNVPVEDCHHGSLELIGGLKNLKKLILKFGSENLGMNYEKRFFECSYDDIENLGKALTQLESLEDFRIYSTRLDDRKIKTLMKSLEKSSFKNIEFSYCNLGNDSCSSIAYLLTINSSLQSLELKGNRFGPEGMEVLSYGLKVFNGNMNYLGLSQNSILEEGVMKFCAAIVDRTDINKLDFSGCNIGSISGTFRIIEIIKLLDSLEELNLSNICLGESVGAKMIEFLKDRFNILKLDVRSCELTKNQETKIRIILERNLYFKENPPGRKDVFTKEDADEIDEWMKRTKHPILVKLKSRTDSVDSFDVSTRKIFYDHGFDYRDQQSNSELLNTNFHSCFGSDSQMLVYNPGGSEIMNEYSNPNDFDEESIFKNFR